MLQWYVNTEVMDIKITPTLHFFSDDKIFKSIFCTHFVLVLLPILEWGCFHVTGMGQRWAEGTPCDSNSSWSDHNNLNINGSRKWCIGEVCVEHSISQDDEYEDPDLNLLQSTEKSCKSSGSKNHTSAKFGI